jgi:outer membrane protein assembly factor BamA
LTRVSDEIIRKNASARRLASMIAPLILLVVLNLSEFVPARVDTADTAVIDSTHQSLGARFIVLPIVFSSPDTRWAGGVLPQVVFETGQGGRSSTIRMDAFYTQNRQFTIRLRPTLWLRQDTYVLGANAAFKKWPTNYYGLYSPADSEFKEPYTELFVESSLEAARRVAPQLYLGLRHDYRRSRLRDVATDGELVQGTTPGSDGGTTSGIGLIVRYDDRDHDFYPSGGGYYQLSVKTAQKFLGSDYRYSAIEIDARRYYSPGGPHAIAGQAVVRLTEGNAPFQLMPGVGSVLRGYSTARYVGADLVALQAEYRVVPLFWRLGLVGFLGAAQVAPSISEFSLAEVKYMIGVGARVQLSRRDAINIRWDFGFGLKSSGDYLDLGEAF